MNSSSCLQIKYAQNTRLYNQTIGHDYIPAGVRPDSGNSSNLRWSGNNTSPDEEFSVNIIVDDIPEPVEVFEVVLECEMNCFLPQEVYTITIIDNLGE